MGDFFGGLRSGIQFPQVVMNQGPLPGAGGLPAPLHETPDARINYGSSLLGDLTPYAYGEPGYLSSQNAYLNIPHKIQKIVPVVFLPEAKEGAKEFFDLSHPVDDGDLAFVLRLDRNSLFCTGLRNADMRRAGLGTAVDPLINLCTLNYILSGLQLGITGTPEKNNLWTELFHNLDKQWFGKPTGVDSRNYEENPISLADVLHVVRNCVRPFGIVRGSEKQGGQDEATMSPATWPVSFVVSVTIDGKESNVLNIWHYHELHAGDDLVLRLKLMPVRPYTLNHYYKGVKRQNWDMPGRYVWQLVPDIFHIEGPTKSEIEENERIFKTLPLNSDFNENRASSLCMVKVFQDRNARTTGNGIFPMGSNHCWQDLGFWHVGRSQIMTGKYGVEEYWHNDLANTLKTNHLDITLQPMFSQSPFVAHKNPRDGEDMKPVQIRVGSKAGTDQKEDSRWKASLQLEKIQGRIQEASSRAPKRVAWSRDSRGLPSKEASVPQGVDGALEKAPQDSLGEIPVLSLSSALDAPPAWLAEPAESTGTAAPPPRESGPASDEPDWLGRLEFTDSDPPVDTSSAPAAPPLPAGKKTGKAGASAGGKRGRPIGGSLLKPDGTSEASMVGML